MCVHIGDNNGRGCRPLGLRDREPFEDSVYVWAFAIAYAPAQDVAQLLEVLRPAVLQGRPDLDFYRQVRRVDDDVDGTVPLARHGSAIVNMRSFPPASK